MLKSIVLICLLYTTGIKGAVVRATPEGYRYETRLQGWLKLHTGLESWRSAKLTCHLEGAFLAAPWTSEFVSAINELQSEHIQPMDVVYSGTHETIAEEAYTYVQGTLTISLDPRDLEKYELCGVIYLNGTLGKVPCKQRLPFVCFVPSSSPADGSTEGTSTTLLPGSEDKWTTTSPAPSTTTSNLNEVTSSLAPAVACGDSSSGYKYSDETGHCYSLHLVPSSWSDARRTCRAEGGDLAVVNSAAEAQLLANLINSNASDWIYAAIGFSYDTLSGTWMTVNGQPLKDAGYDRWENSQPNDDLSFFGSGYLSRNALYSNSAGSYARPFICEKTPGNAEINSLGSTPVPVQAESGDSSYKSTTTKLTQPSTTSPTSENIDDSVLALVPAPACDKYLGEGYKYSNETGHCYLLHSVSRPWSDARRTCLAEGGDLAVVNSAAEAQILANLIRTVVPDWGYVAVGLSYDTRSGVWKTVNGQSIEEAGYVKWGHEQPNDDLRYYSSGYLSRNALFVNTIGLYFRPFICEKTPVLITDSSSEEYDYIT